MHILLSDELKKRLDEFVRARRSSKANKSEIIRYALDRLFEQEHVDPAVDANLKIAINHIMQIPKGYSLRAFFITLYQLSIHYPHASAKEFWGASIFTWPLDLTHLEVFEYINTDWQRRMQHGKKGK